jgi:cytidine deaminase
MGIKTKKYEIVVHEYTSLSDLTENDRLLVEAAMEATKNAWAPYSEFRVGAAAETENGIIIRGNNRENAAFPSGSCAERTVLSYTGANYPDQKIRALAIAATRDGNFTDQPVSPCGNCRQLISEEEDRTGNPIRIILYGRSRIAVLDGVSALLPLRFSNSNLKG